jgi:hypothetical protein
LVNSAVGFTPSEAQPAALRQTSAPVVDKINIRNDMTYSPTSNDIKTSNLREYFAATVANTVSGVPPAQGAALPIVT